MPARTADRNDPADCCPAHAAWATSRLRLCPSLRRDVANRWRGLLPWRCSQQSGVGLTIGGAQNNGTPKIIARAAQRCNERAIVGDVRNSVSSEEGGTPTVAAKRTTEPPHVTASCDDYESS